MFRINCRNFSLTYPQTSEGFKEAIEQFINDLDNVLYYVIGTERHEDGGWHQHVALGFTKKKDIRSQSFFDIDGHHPNIQATRDIHQWISYCKKDGDFIESGSVPKLKRKWSEVLSCTTRDEALSTICEVSARDAIINSDAIMRWIDRKFPTNTQGEFNPVFTEFNISGSMRTWTDQRLDRDRPKSLILYGASRTGKTNWARSLGPHMYFSGMFDLSLWNPDAEYAVFDDWSDWGQFFLYKQWLGAQYQFTMTDKYCKKKTVIWGKPCIILMNDQEYNNLTWDKDWLSKNAIIVHVTNSLF